VGTTVAGARGGGDREPRRRGGPGTPDDGWHTDPGEDAEPPAAVRRLLALDEGERVLVLRRSRDTDGQAVATELLYVPAASVPGLPAEEETDGAVRAGRVLRELHRLRLQGQERAVELGSARADDARMLDRLPGAPVLMVTTRYTADGRTAAVAVATYRADTCRLTISDAEHSLPAA
jgi:DNA-binding GntR family transcriptional regulator